MALSQIPHRLDNLQNRSYTQKEGCPFNQSFYGPDAMRNIIFILLAALLTLAPGCSGGAKQPDTGGSIATTAITPLKVIKNPEVTSKGMKFIYRLKIRPENDIFLTGGFNGWTPNDPKFKLSRGADGLWSVTVKIEAGQWEYKFVVDGQQFYDSFAKEFEQDETGGKKSLVTVR